MFGGCSAGFVFSNDYLRCACCFFVAQDVGGLQKELKESEQMIGKLKEELVESKREVSVMCASGVSQKVLVQCYSPTARG